MIGWALLTVALAGVVALGAALAVVWVAGREYRRRRR